MNVDPAPVFRPSTEPQVEPGEVRAGQTPLAPRPGSGSTGENKRPQSAPAVAASPQDEVRVQWDTPDHVVIYQFVNRRGSLILQIPSEQMLSLARQITQELVREAAPKKPAGNEGGETNGH